ncbi:MAG: shikimate kinase [Candidatus Poribacteria bacterium]|nr:shikimate kinase [Candidatus Poribacteria bacterium]
MTNEATIFDTVLLIGPIGTGKSTLGGLVSERLGVPRVGLDETRFRYYAEIGYDKEQADELGKKGFLHLYRYWKAFEIHAVERILQDHRNCVIDFGGGHSVYEDDALFERAQRALAAYAFVILILPAPDLDESVRLLNERRGEVKDGDFDFHEHFVKHPSNGRLATHTIYTRCKTPEQSADEIVALVEQRFSRDAIQNETGASG